MSIVRIGMSEDDKFGKGYEAIFGKKAGRGEAAAKPAGQKPAAKAAAGKKKPANKKK